MAKIERFEDLQGWQKARQLANLIYDLTQHPKFSEDFRLIGQIQDAAGSVMHNMPKVLTLGQILNSSASLKSQGVLPARCNLSCILRLTAIT